MVERFACLGWGSLIWAPGSLPSSIWMADGPELPLEFARQSKDGRATLVVCEGAQTSQVLWSDLRVKNLDDAISELADRERCPRSKIGRWPGWGGATFPGERGIGEWAKAQRLDGVVWTALPANWGGEAGQVPTLKQVAQHIQGLDTEGQTRAARYILNAPKQIQTNYREELEKLAQSIVKERSSERGSELER